LKARGSIEPEQLDDVVSRAQGFVQDGSPDNAHDDWCRHHRHQEKDADKSFHENVAPHQEREAEPERVLQQDRTDGHKAEPSERFPEPAVRKEPRIVLPSDPVESGFNNVPARKADPDREQEWEDDDCDQDDEPGKEKNMFVFQLQHNASENGGRTLPFRKSPRYGIRNRTAVGLRSCSGL